MRLTIGEIAACLGLSCEGDAATAVTSVATDSRQVQAGGLFVCIPGERVDGHDFATSAAERGAVLVLAQRALPDVAIPVLVVPDSVRALGAIAALWRTRVSGKVIAITGTCGKTTVKESLAQVLSVAGKTAKTTLNHNNQIGMPCDFLNTDGDEAFYVMEAGISHDGDMDDLGAILRPDVAIIVNVGAGHTEGLGAKGVAWHKSRLLNYLAPQGTALVSCDYPDLLDEARAFGDCVEFFSTNQPECDNRASYIGPAPGGEMGRFAVHLGEGYCDISAPFHGEYGAENVVAVAACASLLGLDCSQIKQGFAQLSLPPQRFRRLKIGSWEVFDDTYNANPLSMHRMLNTVAHLATGRPLTLVLGAMGELGEQAEALHETLGQDIARVKPLVVFWKGPFAANVRKGLDGAAHFVPVDDAGVFLAAWQNMQHTQANLSGGYILFKGSRANHLETFLQAFTEQEEGHAVNGGGTHVL